MGRLCSDRCDNVIASTKRVFMGDALLGHFHIACVVRGVVDHTVDNSHWPDGAPDARPQR